MNKCLFVAALAAATVSTNANAEAFNGAYAGAVVEFAFSDRITARVAYTRTSYSVSDDLKAAFGADVDINRDQVMGGVAFHF
jgi:hypothetical protein